MRRIRHRLQLAALAAILVVEAAAAACGANVAGGARVWRAAAGDAGGVVRISWLGHAAMRIESPGGVAAVADYFGEDGPFPPPAIATMNNLHSMHWTPTPDPATRIVLHGWTTAADGGPHDVLLGDLRARSVATNTRLGSGGTRYGGSSIFVFETAGICLAHLGHLHHLLEAEHLTQLGRIDVLMVPADGAWTLSLADAAEVTRQIAPRLVIPMHYVGDWMAERFLAALPYPARRHDAPVLEVSLATLPRETEAVALPLAGRR